MSTTPDIFLLSFSDFDSLNFDGFGQPKTNKPFLASHKNFSRFRACKNILPGICDCGPYKVNREILFAFMSLKCKTPAEGLLIARLDSEVPTTTNTCAFGRRNFLFANA